MIPPKTKKLIKVYWIIIIVIFSIMWIRLGILQLVQASIYQTQSEDNSIRMIPIRAPRGEIKDRNGVVLARSKQVFSVVLSGNSKTCSEVTINRLADILNQTYPEITPEYIREKIDQHQGHRYEPVLIKRDIDWPCVVRLEEARGVLPGITIEVGPIRDYPMYQDINQVLAGHVLGFVREINKTELEELNQEAEEGEEYKPGDLIGKNGLEKTYENELRGQDGARLVEVDAHDRPIRNLKTIPAIPGNTLVLTLDAQLQSILEKSMDEVITGLQKQGIDKAGAGAAVVIDVNTGGILAMASRPYLNPNDFIGYMTQDMVNFYYSLGPYKEEPTPAVNRAIAGMYPPGSTFKPVTALAALESHAVKPEQILVNCQGAYWIRPYIRCWGVHGPVNLYSAMARSCNTYFQEAGRLAGQERIAMVAQQLGLGSRTGIDLPGEAKGVLPTPEYKKKINEALLERRYENLFNNLEKKYQDKLNAAVDEKTRDELLSKKEQEKNQLEAQYKIDYRFNTTWQPFDTFNMSIGQGYNNYTPLQLANYVATIANGGKHFQPYLVDRIETPSGEVVKKFEPILLNQIAVSPENLAYVQKAMEEVVRPGGTAWSVFRDFPENIPVAAKTGTAQTGRKGDDSNSDFHGVFVAYAPADNPEIAFAGVIEYGKHGNSSAGYVARAVFQEYFGLNK